MSDTVDTIYKKCFTIKLTKRDVEIMEHMAKTQNRSINNLVTHVVIESLKKYGCEHMSDKFHTTYFHE